MSGKPGPTKFTEEARVAYLALLSAGVGRRDAARQVGVSPRQVAAVRQTDEGFRELCEDAEADANEPVVLALHRAAKNGEQWAVKLWLTNRDAGNWRDKVDVDQHVSGTVNLETPGLADIIKLGKELDARRADLELGTGSEEVIDVESWESPDTGSVEVSG